MKKTRVNLASIFAVTMMVLAAGPPPALAAARTFSDKDVSGMYTFVQEGEFVQITVETDAGHEPVVTGFVSRYGQDESPPA